MVFGIGIFFRESHLPGSLPQPPWESLTTSAINPGHPSGSVPGNTLLRVYSRSSIVGKALLHFTILGTGRIAAVDLQ
ncbi:hypothetical protein BDW62DRAFT_186642 [Aspergillus aurantiobrunneus]